MDHVLHGLLESILEQLQITNHGIKHMSADLSALVAAVQANADAEQSAIALMADLAQRFEDSKADPAQAQALADQLRANAAALSAAVLANTPAAPAAPAAAESAPAAPPADPAADPAQ